MFTVKYACRPDGNVITEDSPAFAPIIPHEGDLFRVRRGEGVLRHGRGRRGRAFHAAKAARGVPRLPAEAPRVGDMAHGFGGSCRPHADENKCRPAVRHIQGPAVWLGEGRALPRACWRVEGEGPGAASSKGEGRRPRDYDAAHPPMLEV